MKLKEFREQTENLDGELEIVVLVDKRGGAFEKTSSEIEIGLFEEMMGDFVLDEDLDEDDKINAIRIY